ncbi:MAG: hypothetical protein EOO38_19900 [Cytophagaceae bacterium]|nr:MAG: hypothetical protein EOO38_19900 [Cytophagaceae bacterium]
MTNKFRPSLGPPERKTPDVDRFLVGFGSSVAGGAFLGASLFNLPGAIIGGVIGAIAAVATLRR